jgi:hypothetical protein
MHCFRREVLLVPMVLLAALGARPGPVHHALAAPEIILVYGAPLSERRVLADQWENLRLLLAIDGRQPASPIPLPRPSLQIALFWGQEWRATARSPALLRALRPERANQRGLFYPATSDAPAMFDFAGTIGVVSDSGLAIFRRHGVPTRM